MTALRRFPICFSAVLGIFLAAPLSAQPVKTLAPLSIHGDLELGGSGITFGNGSVQPSAGITYARTVVVSPAQTPTQSGDALRAALSAITDAAETTPALLKIEPGVYDLGSQPLQMKAWVDIEGSGQRMTLLKGSVSGLAAGVVIGSSYAELRWLSVENTGSGTYCNAIFNEDCAPHIRRVTARASGGSYNSAILNRFDAMPTISHVAVEANGPATVNAGVYNIESSPFVSDVEATACDGLYNYGFYYNQGTARLTRVSVHAHGGQTAMGLYSYDTWLLMTAVDFAASGAGTGNYGLFLYLASGRIEGARIEASYGSANYGVHMTASSPDLSDLSIDVKGAWNQGNQNYGVYLTDTCGPRLDRVAVAVADGAGNRAVYSQSSSPVLTDVTAIARGADSHGLYLDTGGGSLQAYHSVFQGGTQSVFNASGATARFGGSRLHGAINGPCVCAACYNGTFATLDAGCH